VFKFLTTKPLWVNILTAIALVMFFILLFFGLLNWITDHGHYEKVPSIVGQNADAARLALQEKGFTVEVTDSLYDPNSPKLSVLKQVPEADAQVKHGRTVFLTVNRAQAPLIDMPNLVGFSIRSASMYLNSIGLKLGDTTYKPDIARNSVLTQLFNGSEIKPGTKIPLGSTISFVLGSGLGDSEMIVPPIIGLSYAAAKTLLSSKNIGMSNPVFMDANIKDTLAAFVVKQNPEPYTETTPGNRVPNKIKPGQIMDIYLGSQPPIVDTTKQSGNP